MKIIANFVQLPHNDIKATSHIINNLQATAYSRALSRKILDRWSGAAGSLTAIFGSGIDLDLLSSYDCVRPVPDNDDFQYDGATEERTRVRLVRFVADYLGSTVGAVVVCEDWLYNRADIPNMGLVPPRITCFGDEVYYLLTPEITDPDAIEDTVVPSSRYQTGVCSTCGIVPDGDILDEGFLDEVARNARHIFVPAFDGSGYLIWSLA